MNELLTRIVAGVLPAHGANAGLTKLAALLDLPIEEVMSVTTNPRLSYRPFTIRKRGGGKRRISAPSSALKKLQRRLLHRYLVEQPIHEAAMAFRAGYSIATHARRHLGQAIVLTVDLADFFPATAAHRVRGWFREMGWGGDALQILMRLCVYHGGLPQGAPTSPALSNLVNQPLDEGLSELAGRHGARYSRYSDDLAFSWPTDSEPSAFRQQVGDKLGRFGYHIQPSKGWRLQRANQRPEITGLVLDGRRLRLSHRILRRIRQLQSRWFSRDAAQRQQLEGYRGLRKMLR